MPKIDFYLLNLPDQQLDRFVCKLTEKAWLQAYHIYIYAQSSQQAQHLNHLLWVFNDTSFIPHQVYDPQTDSPHRQVDIGVAGNQTHPQYETAPSLLINLHHEIPAFINQFQRIAEIVPQQGDDLPVQAGRARYRAYRKAGYELGTPHKINRI